MQLLYWLLAVVISFIAAFWVYRADKRRAVPYPMATSVLRGLVVLSTLLLILVPDIVITKNFTEQPILLMLHDNSVSAGIALGKDSTTYRKDIENLSQKLSQKYTVVQWGFGKEIQQDSLFRYDKSATDISDALSRAEELYGMQNLGAIVLASDGRFNQGINPEYRPSAYQGTIYSVAFGDSVREKDIKVSRVYANNTATINSSFEIRADIIAESATGYNNDIALKEGNELLGSANISVNRNRYDRAISFTVKADKPGVHHYVLYAPVMEGEANETNNRRDIYVEVTDRKKNILIAAAAPHPDVNALKDALSSLESYKVTICTGDKFPTSVSQYDAIILHGLPSLSYRLSEALTAAKKPLWFILTSATDYVSINKLKSITHTGIAQAPPHNIQAVYHSAFNAFTVPPRINIVADKMPPLSGYSGNINSAPGANILFTQKTPAGIMPAWVMQQGAIPTAILAGEGIWRWRLYEYKNFDEHNVIDECIKQTVAFLCANNREKPFNVMMPKHVWSDQEPVSFNAYLLNANNEQINTSDVQLSVRDSTGHTEEYSMERSGTGYNLNIGIHAGGKYTYVAKSNFNGKALSSSGSFVVQTIPLELMETGADYPLLYNLAKKHNGTFVTAGNVATLYDSIITNKRITPLIKTNTETVPLIDRKWFFFIILGLALAEWLLRKYWLAQ